MWLWGEGRERRRKKRLRYQPDFLLCHSPVTRQGDSSLLRSKTTFPMFLMLRAWPVKTFAPWLGATFLGRCFRFGDQGKAEKDQRGVTKMRRSTHVGRSGGAGPGMLMKRRVRAGCNHNLSDVEGVPKEHDTKPT